MQLNQEELAVASGLSRVTISRYERGELTPPADVLVSLVRALGPNAEADWLLFGLPTDIEKTPLRLPSFGLVTAMRFDGGGSVDVSMGFSEIKKILRGLIFIEESRTHPNEMVISAVEQIERHFHEIEYSELGEPQLEMVAEALIAMDGVRSEERRVGKECRL